MVSHVLHLTTLASAAALIAGATIGCSTPPPDDAGYVKQIEARRAATNLAYSDPSQEPNIPREQQQDYLPLAYYPVDLRYHVPAVLKPAKTRETVEIPTSTGPVRRMERIGRLEFTVKGQQLGLSAFAEAGSGRLFVPFRDETSRSETYPGGRYLDLDPTPTGLYEVDFNLAYHPYCYFNSGFECPFPPPENRLPIAVEAGEKLSDKKRAELNPGG
ncbi:MAG TPA: DUF1684 domain-containing protein [Vicinamibacterales bacterium]